MFRHAVGCGEEDEDSGPWTSMAIEDMDVTRHNRSPVSTPYPKRTGKEANMTINIPLLRKGVEWVEEQEHLPWEEREWDQRTWHRSNRAPSFPHSMSVAACGTAFCLAGFVAISNGWRPDQTGFFTNEKTGELKYAPKLACELLGIDPIQGDHLFLAYNTAKDIREIAESIAGERL